MKLHYPCECGHPQSAHVKRKLFGFAGRSVKCHCGCGRYIPRWPYMLFVADQNEKPAERLVEEC
jgi:hypothetical protein